MGQVIIIIMTIIIITIMTIITISVIIIIIIIIIMEESLEHCTKNRLMVNHHLSNSLIHV